MTKDASGFIPPNDTFSFNGNHYYVDGLRYDFIDIKCNNEIDLETHKLNGLILKALKWASQEIGQDVEYLGITPYGVASSLVVSIKYLS